MSDKPFRTYKELIVKLRDEKKLVIDKEDEEKVIGLLKKYTYVFKYSFGDIEAVQRDKENSSQQDLVMYGLPYKLDGHISRNLTQKTRIILGLKAQANACAFFMSGRSA